MIETIPFGALMLTPKQVFKMAETLWNNSFNNCTVITWTNLSDRDKENFIRDYILTIPKTLGTIGLKAGKK